MNKYLSLAFVALALAFISWGNTGHKTIGQIAENHLSPQAKSAVAAYLKGQSLSDVASWADEVRNQPEYRSTAPMHFINVPLGLTHDEFVKAVKTQEKENVYTALVKYEHELSDKNTSVEQKTIALKFIVHFVGDLHQPMHVSREEDKGGNTIQVTYEGRGTNLHSLWDTKLLEHQGLKYNELAIAYDKATPAEIKQWQNSDPIDWCYESYVITNKLYPEVAKENAITEDYYKTHLPIIEKRIDEAGIRLAGILNEAFKNFKVTNVVLVAPPAVKAPTPEPNPAVPVPIEEVAKHIGEEVTVISTMSGSKSVSGMTLVNMGGEYPNQLLTVVLKGEALQAYQNWGTNKISVTGKVIDYKGKPEIIVTSLNQIRVLFIVGEGTTKGRRGG